MGRRRQPFRHFTRLPVAAIELPEPAAPLEPEVLQRFAQSLRRQGQREPVLVTPAAGKDTAGKDMLRLVVGRKRLLAARKVGWKELDAVVLDATFRDEIAAIDALQAGTYEPWALAAVLQRLRERCEWTQTQLGVVLGRNRDFVTGLLALTAIGPEVRAYLQQHADGRRLSPRHLRYIGRTPPARQMRVAKEIVEQGLSTKVLEQRFRRGGAGRSFIKVRPLRTPGSPRGPRTLKEWRRYYRKLRTDLRRVEEQERHELRRTAEVLTQARQRQTIIRREARAKRQLLSRELRKATRQLSRHGTL